MKEAINIVITELTILSSRLTPHWREKVDACIKLLQEQLDSGAADPDPQRAITLLTHDAEAGMAYVYLAPPCGCPGRVARTEQARYGLPEYEVQLDYGANGLVLGAEFPAATKEEALERAADVLANAE